MLLAFKTSQFRGLQIISESADLNVYYQSNCSYIKSDWQSSGYWEGQGLCTGTLLRDSLPYFLPSKKMWELEEMCLPRQWETLGLCSLHSGWKSKEGQTAWPSPVNWQNQHTTKYSMWQNFVRSVIKIQRHYMDIEKDSFVLEEFIQ